MQSIMQMFLVLLLSSMQLVAAKDMPFDQLLSKESDMKGLCQAHRRVEMLNGNAPYPIMSKCYFNKSKLLMLYIVATKKV